ncbi:hypothetical protein [uncultured Chitinophaga sp.]|uniref:hypothetical protein n=1 Tax=uncultured Chitinophaga sp. TaxID=339340 RepID=UPI0025CEB5B7|nr:hypothetical protein [uncultured Chitinophaga sp.]
MRKRILLLFLAIPVLSVAQLPQGIAGRYPGDKGIEKDSNVLFVEDFETGMNEVLARYSDVLNKAGMSMDADVPKGSAGKQSMKMTNIGGVNTGGHLYRNFKPGFDSTVYIRYYVKYPKSDSNYIHHEAIWFGGYDPVLPYPSPKAAVCNVEGRISVSYEASQGGQQMDTYIYWPFMNSGNGFRCYGNVFFDPKARRKVDWDEWMCIEVMVKLNNPVEASNGELAVWCNGKLMGHWGPGFPGGRWVRDKFIANDTDPGFEGFRWRTKPSLNINYIWIEYFDDFTPAGMKNHIKYDHIVVARKYIGPIKE